MTGAASPQADDGLQASAGRRTARRRDYPGWRMVWALAVTETVAYGVLFYSFAVFLVPVRTELGASTAQVSAALSVSLAVGGLAAPLAGRWLDAHGARALMTCGSLLGAACVVGWSQARTLPQLYAAFAGIGLAGAAVLYEPAFAVINTWFARERVRALLALTVVAGFSSTIFLPLAQALEAALGWRDALLVLAGLLALCSIPQAVLLRRSPGDLGLRPDGDAEAAVLAGPPPPVQHHPGAVPWLTTAAVLHTAAITIVAVHLIAYLTELGSSPATAAATAGAIGIAQVAGRLVLTALAGRAGLGRVTAAMLAVQAVGVVALLGVPRPAGQVLFVVLFGAGFGVMSIARAALLGGYVAPGVFARTSGRQAVLTNAGRVVAPVAAGTVVGVAGYGPAFAGVGACTVLAAAALLLAERAAEAGRLHGPV